MMFKRKNEKLEMLATAPLFSGLSKRDLGVVARSVDIAEFPAGTRLIGAGDRPRQFIIVAEGLAEAWGARGCTPLPAGYWCGVTELLTDQAHESTVKSRTAVKLLIASRPAFTNLLHELPVLRQHLLHELGGGQEPAGIPAPAVASPAAASGVVQG